ncbi:hypothetical protein [Novosphingobium album (ex Liu et al. 2023)]|uniref:Uncharacterized protein n=1 Tax=Novosphingobium album (ex Liu et al. 2023) TaxID=3031130 RepID=A0ABT5WRQ4_9SPHN|nr:hypothetical protein [Novosphingobium album (ex Liu et al. 2023)]MDE8652732.1 hypothetical protein [Novosphingobium album (ex Liu et al. 2023)]
MTEERIVTTESEAAPTNHTTIIREGGSGGVAGIFLGLVLLVAVIGGIYVYSRSSASEAAKDNAVAEAASDVGNAAQAVGDAAKDAASTVDKN